MDPEARQAAIQRRIFLVRLAAWGTVLVLAAIAFNLRAGASEPDNGANGPQLNGETDQKLPIWAVVGDGQVREIEMRWRAECDNGDDVDSWGGTFRAETDEWDANGRRFTVKDRYERDATGGWTAYVKVELTGEAKSEGRAEGEGAVVMWFQRGKERGTECRSGVVRWRAGS
jgi:hypothetical protein